MGNPIRGIKMPTVYAVYDCSNQSNQEIMRRFYQVPKVVVVNKERIARN